MRPFKIIAACFFTSAVVFSACGTSSSSGAGGGQCANIFIKVHDCGQCMVEKCCPEAAACHAVDNCIACYVGHGDFNHPPCSAASDQADALGQCAWDKCKYECNPDQFCANGAHPSDGGGCTDTEPDGGVTAAECQGQFITILRGTLDGKPFSTKYEGGYPNVDQLAMPALLSMISTEVSVNLTWRGMCLYTDGAPVPVTG